jgi:hypothetical protein
MKRTNGSRGPSGYLGAAGVLMLLAAGMKTAGQRSHPAITINPQLHAYSISTLRRKLPKRAPATTNTARRADARN